MLRDLELGSRFTWELAHQDLLAEEPFYGEGDDTPYPFIFVGTQAYGGLRKLLGETGTDGTVRLAGVGFNSRKIELDLTREQRTSWSDRVAVKPWRNAEVPLVLVDGTNHAEILRAPPAKLVDAIRAALQVGNAEQYREWRARFGSADPGEHSYQQFLIRARDERGDPIDDYFVQLGLLPEDGSGEFEVFDGDAVDGHAYQADTSFRCLHVDLDRVRAEPGKKLWLRVLASSGTDLVSYGGIQWGPMEHAEHGQWSVMIDLTEALSNAELGFFWPLTTTLVELTLNREPLKGRVFWFV